MVPGDSIAGPLLVGLAFGGGLVPGLLDANSKALGSLRDGPSSKLRQVSSAAGSSTLPCSRFLLYPQPVYVADVVDVISRCTISILQPDGGNRMLRKDEFEGLLARQPARALTVTSSGAGNGALVAPVSRKAPPPALAVDAAWTALSGGSPYVQPQEVERQISRWRPDASTLDLDEFSRSLVQGRAVVGSGYVILFGLQALTLALLVVKPLMELLVVSE